MERAARMQSTSCAVDAAAAWGAAQSFGLGLCQRGHTLRDAGFSRGREGADGSSLELLSRGKRRAKVVQMWHAGPGWEPQLEIRLSWPISRSSCEVRRFWWDSLVTRE